VVNSTVSGILTATGAINSSSVLQISGTTVVNNDKELGTGLVSVFDRVFTVGVSTTLQNRDILYCHFCFLYDYTFHHLLHLEMKLR